MTVLLVTGGRKLSGHVVPPPDKSIAHRALIMAALARGPSRIEAPPFGADNRSTRAVLEGLGVEVEDGPDGARIVHGVGGVGGLHEPEGPLDCGNSGTTMRLMAGVLAAAPFDATLTGDESLQGRPMSRLLPLERMGAKLSGTLRGDKLYPPLTVYGRPLKGAFHDLEIASAQVKSALLLAGLFADGPTRVREPGRSRDHTERMLRSLGVDLREEDDGTLRLEPLAAPWRGFSCRVPPDFSSAAFLLAASALVEGSEVSVETGTNPLRTGFLEALHAFGVQVELAPRSFQRAASVIAVELEAEPTSVVTVRGSVTQPAEIRDPISLRAIDELPLVAVVAACAPGRTQIHDAAELRVKESDRIAKTVELLTSFGVPAQGRPDGLIIEGGGPRRPGSIDAGHDHRIAMAAAVLGLATAGTTQIRGAEVIDVSFPGFAETLRSLGGEVELQPGSGATTDPQGR